MAHDNIFHKGELEVQRITGEQDIAAINGGIIQGFVLSGALNFIHQQSIIWIGLDDDENFLWSFPLFGSPGFINSNKGELLEIDLDEKFYIHDGWLKNLKKGKSIGCLVIEFSTRRRVRINGIIKEINKNLLQIDVNQAYPNCPQYIRRREIPETLDLCKFHFESKGIELNEKLENIISQSDTAFVASRGPNGVDVSHRGGPYGFIKCDSPNKVIVPDYKGNSMFNTLGNFKTNPFGGLIIIEFHQGYFLQLTGKTSIIFNKDDPEIVTGGTNRFWELVIHKWQLFQLDPNFEWQNIDFFNLKSIENYI